MPTDKQLAANRENAKRSTGPRTPAGKKRSSRNAVKHDLFTLPTNLAGRGKDRFEELSESLRNYYQPENPIEADLVDQIILARWRLALAQRLEIGFWDKAFDPAPSSDPDSTVNRALADHLIDDAGSGKNAFARILRYDAAIRRAYAFALNALIKLREHRSLGGYITKPISKDRAPFRKFRKPRNHVEPAPPPEIPTADDSPKSLRE